MVLGILAVYFFYSRFVEPRSVFLRSLESIEEIKSFSFQLTSDISSADAKTWKLGARAEGEYDRIQESPYFQSSIALDSQTPYRQYQASGLAISIVSPESDVAYVRFQNVPREFIVNLAPISGQWVQFDSRNTQKKDFFVPEKIVAVKGILISGYIKNEFLKLEKLSSEKILKKRSYHYSVSLKKDIFENFIKDISKGISNADMEYSEKIFFESSVQQVRDFIMSHDFSAEIWIGKGDYYIRKLVIKAESDPNSPNGFRGSVVFFSNDFNVAKKREIPESSMSIEEAFTKITGNKLGDYLPQKNVESRPATGDTYPDPDLDDDGLPDFMEKKLKTDLYNPDSNGNGIKDGEEFLRGDNPARN